MPIVTANNCAMYYEIDDYTDPWATGTETVWLQHGVGRSSKFWYHWVPALARQYRVPVAICVAMASRVTPASTTNGRSTN
jgi:hypothetical protein